MSLRIYSLKNHGNAGQEYICLDVLEDCNLGDYAIADSTYGEKGKVSNKWRHLYWFKNQAVKKNDFVVLYTRKGANTVRDFERGTEKLTVKVYDLFWNSDAPIWNDDIDCAALIRLSVVDSKKKD